MIHSFISFRNIYSVPTMLHTLSQALELQQREQKHLLFHGTHVLWRLGGGVNEVTVKKNMSYYLERITEVLGLRDLEHQRGDWSKILGPLRHAGLSIANARAEIPV